VTVQDPAIAELIASLESALSGALDRLNAFDTRLTTLETETVDAHAERTHRNTNEAILAKQREHASRYAPADLYWAERRRLGEEREFWASGERMGRPWLLKVQAEEQSGFDALGDKEPNSRVDEWRRKREDHADTLEQIRKSVREAPAGNLYALARRDGIDRRDLERMPGLRYIEHRLAEIDAALAALPPK
jgi:hypothetical protein